MMQLRTAPRRKLFRKTILVGFFFMQPFLVLGETAGLSNKIRWATASEIHNFGYDVFRADAEEGPFSRLNETPIAGSGTTSEPQHYAYIDKTIEPDTAYYYYVESISIDGERERFTPVIRAKPKSVATGTDSSKGDPD